MHCHRRFNDEMMGQTGGKNDPLPRNDQEFVRRCSRSSEVDRQAVTDQSWNHKPRKLQTCGTHHDLDILSGNIAQNSLTDWAKYRTVALPTRQPLSLGVRSSWLKLLPLLQEKQGTDRALACRPRCIVLCSFPTQRVSQQPTPASLPVPLQSSCT